MPRDLTRDRQVALDQGDRRRRTDWSALAPRPAPRTETRGSTALRVVLATTAAGATLFALIYVGRLAWMIIRGVAA